jgi:hypothetical protein
MNYHQKYLKYKDKYLKLKSKQLSRQLSRQHGGAPGDTINGTIYKIYYCGFSVKVDGKDLVVYVQKYPPAGGTTVPDMNKISPPEELVPDNVSREELVNFWNSPEIRQPNGNWKGGEWGSNNLVTTGNWVTGAFIGDRVKLTVVADGILPFKDGKTFRSNQIVSGSESQALSCYVILDNEPEPESEPIPYTCYVTGNVMPQVANDVLFIYKNITGKKFIKLLKRSIGPNVDMPKKMMPGAGEHLEPGLDIKFNEKKDGFEGVLRSLNDEIGVTKETLKQCYLLDLGLYNEPGRDPRYWSFNLKRSDGTDIDFGIKRGSESHGYVVYFESSSDAAPTETNPLDTEEIDVKWWHQLNKVLLIEDNDWMIFDHKNLVINAIIKTEQFDYLGQEEKEQYKMKV